MKGTYKTEMVQVKKSNVEWQTRARENMRKSEKTGGEKNE